jgi:hypothetical protein
MEGDRINIVSEGIKYLNIFRIAIFGTVAYSSDGVDRAIAAISVELKRNPIIVASQIIIEKLYARDM